MNGFYHPGRSPLHRMPAVAKLLTLMVAVTVVAFLRSPGVLACALLVTGLLYLVAGIPPRLALRAVGPIFWVLLIAVPLNGWLVGWESAVSMGLRVVTVVALAGLFTLTTTVSAVLGAVEALLRPVPRVDADRVGLLLALTIRAIPLLSEIVGSVLEARRARGVDRSLRAIAVPVIVRSLQSADELGDALIARGVDD
ncbi:MULTISPECIES: energy-coupling factor transporter transmembrane component T family protein [unclassified Leifsonia]|uniref:energy-coupling factor transporter transmembrane component T family protein n=1 Tax=unclassified Leifsonia TaxID=2663824 RepID=UPI000B172ED1|nr:MULTISPECIES: energy-coupling factor transporter transmembrane protein EcfT [unclassified Leifsonia]